MTMIFKLTSVDELRLLQQKVDCVTVKFPKSDKLFVYEGDNLHQYGYNKIPFFQKDTGHLVNTTATELLVEIDHRTYELHLLKNEEDYNLASELLEYYLNTNNLSDEQERFVYLLTLVICDYESQHYPIPTIPTVDFIETLLEERRQTWYDLRKALGYGDSVDISYIQKIIEKERTTHDELRSLSHFFRLPINCFVQGGYG